MPRDGFYAIGTQQAIPPRQIKPKVRVRFPMPDRMVDAVHIGSHEDPSKDSIHRGGHPYVAVVKHGRGVQQYFKAKDGQRRRPEDDDGGHFNDH